MSVALSITPKNVSGKQHMTLTLQAYESKKNYLCHVLL